MTPKDFAGVQLKLGPIYVYSLTMMLGMLTAILTIWYFWKREKYLLKTFVKFKIFSIFAVHKTQPLTLFWLLYRNVAWIFLKS